MLFFYHFLYSQNLDSIRIKNDLLLKKLEVILENNGSFKDAVFISEQGYGDRVSPLNYYNYYIEKYKRLILKFASLFHDSTYHQSDSLNIALNQSVFMIMCRKIGFLSDSLFYSTIPFSYNFEDPEGEKDPGNTFVTHLLGTHLGNCRSLAYLYKILANEIGASCWLSLAPNHIYIRNYSNQHGWYNTELTSGTFPTDAWIAATGYINPDAIRSGLYMDTLSNQQSIALCIIDLMNGYIRQTNNFTDGFVLKCCNIVLKYQQINPMALLLKAEALKQIFLLQKSKSEPNAFITFNEMEKVYISLIKYGYREMPLHVYKKWVNHIKEKEKSYSQKK